MGVQRVPSVSRRSAHSNSKFIVKWADSNRQLSPIIAHKRILARVTLRHLVHCRDNNTHD